MGTCAHGRDVWLFLLFSVQLCQRWWFWGLGSGAPGYEWTAQVNPQAKTGTLLIHRQQEVNLKEAHKDDQCPTKARLHRILVDCWRVNKYAIFLWAVPALLKDKQWFEGLLRCIPPQARRAVSGKPAGCYSAAGGKKFHPVTECWRKIKAKFPSGLCPLTILLPCQPQQFGSVSFSFHLAQWWTVHSQHKDFSIRV